jgi:hypothetical protein
MPHGRSPFEPDSADSLWRSSVAATDSVEIVSYQAAADEKGLGAHRFLEALLLNLDRAFMGLPITGDSVEDLMGAFAAGAESIRAGHFLVLNGHGYAI